MLERLSTPTNPPPHTLLPLAISSSLLEPHWQGREGKGRVNEGGSTLMFIEHLLSNSRLPGCFLCMI